MTKSSEEDFNKAADRAKFEETQTSARDLANLRAKLATEEEAVKQAAQVLREKRQEAIEERARELMKPPPPTLEMSGKPPRRPLREDEARQQAERNVDASHASALAEVRLRIAAEQEQHIQTHREEQGFAARESVIEKFRAERKADRTDEVLRRSDPAPERDPTDRER